MLDALMGVPGKLKTLLDRLTATRAGYLDNLDAAVTTRAAASTALSTATWTSTRAGYLDNLSSAPLSTAINRIQSGTIQLTGTMTSGTATITSVDTSKSLVIWNGVSISTSGTAFADFGVRLALTSGTTVTATRVGNYGGPTVAFTVIEFK